MTRWFWKVLYRVRAIVRPRAMEEELDDEVRFHLERETEKNLARGMSPAEARREAYRRFGGVDRFKERSRDARGTRWLDDLRADLRYGLRRFRNEPGFSLLTVATLALGIGGTVAIFSVVSGLLLRPLPFQHEDRLRVFWSEYNWRGSEFDYVRERVEAFDGLAAYSSTGYTFSDGSGATMVPTTVGSAELFDVLGARPALGRTFRPGEDRPGAESVVVISHGFWRQELGADPGVVGRRIVLDGEPVTVIGVMPPGFYFPSPEFRIWRPLMLDPADPSYSGNGWLVLVGRARDGVGPAGLEAELGRITAALGARFTYPEAWDKTEGAYFTPVREYLLGDVRPGLWLLLGAVGLLLLTACVNVGTLLLARATARREEMAVRSALGAGRGRLTRQVLTETLLLGLVSGSVGAALAAGVFEALVGALALEQGFGEVLTLDWGLVGAAFALAGAVGLVVGLAPLLGTLRGRPGRRLSGERSDTGGASGTGRLQAGLVGAQVVLAVVLVTGAVLLVRSVDRLQRVETGLDPAGVHTVGLLVGGEEMSTEERRAFFQETVGRVGALPGVETAGVIPRVPIRDGGWQGPVTVEGRPDLAGPSRPNSFWRYVTPATLDALGLEIVRGRGVEPTDGPDDLAVTLVSETLARRVWPDEDPLGKRLRSPFQSGESVPWLTVVGVVEDVRLAGVRSEPQPVLYRPLAQSDYVGEETFLVVRSGLDPAAVSSMVRGTIAATHPSVAIHRVATLESIVRDSIGDSLRIRSFLLLFGGLALALGMVGVYGVVTYAVSRRRREYGIRLALGEDPGRLVGHTVRRGLVPVVIGTLAGLGLALLLSGVLDRFLFEVDPADPASMAAAGGALLLAGALAAYLPARRASRVDPVEALRAE